MGQRLDRNTSNQTLVNNPVSAGSNASNSAANNNVTSSSSSSSSTSSSNMPHFSSNVRSRNSRSSGQIANSQQTPSSNNRDLSPRARLRSEMARQGVGSSDLFFRLFQLQSSPNSTSSSTNQSNNPLRLFNFGTSATSTNTSHHNNNEIDDLNSDLSSDEDEPHWNHNLNSLAQSLPFFLGMRDLKCFVCNKMIPADDVEAHIMMCLTKPRLTYNEDVLQSDDKGECIICLELLEQGQTIARLPCLCIYHKTCIDNWFQRSQSCPNHPTD